MIGRKTLKSQRARGRQIDIFFERAAQAMLLSYALFVFISWLSYRPVFHITGVVIDGLHAASPDNIIITTNDALSSRFAAHIFRNNMFLYPRERMLRDIAMADSHIASVSLSFDSRHTLRIAVREYTTARLFCQLPDGEAVAMSRDETTSTTTRATNTPGGESQHCYYADDQGYIFADAAEWSGHPYVTFVSSSTPPSLGTHILPGEEYARVSQFLSLLGASNLHPHTVTILGNNDFRIETMLDWDILWSSKKDPQKSTDNLALVLNSLKVKGDGENEKALQSIDLRFGDKIFYKKE